jgi:hypothetical protein
MLVATSLLALMLQSGSAAAAAPIHKSFEARADWTGSGVPQTLTVQIDGKSFHSPFKYSVTLRTTDGKTLFHVAGEDSKEADEAFSDPEYAALFSANECVGYEACKRKWYFEEFPKMILDSAKPAEHAWLPYGDRESNDELLVLSASWSLKEQGVPEKTIKRTLNEIREILSKPGYRELRVSLGPVDHGSGRIWVPSLSLFVEYDKP